jgi:hypothetical protein
MLAERAFQDKNKVVWVRLNNFNYPRMALYLPSRHRKEAMCEPHEGIDGGHNATHKTYLKFSTSYFWPKKIQDIEKHKNFCLRCQQQKKSTNKRTLDHPNSDLFGLIITADINKKFVLCITDAFTKYAVVTAIASPNSHGRQQGVC